MLLYLRIPDYPKDKRSNPPIPEPTNVLLQDSIARHHQAAASKLYQRAREDYFCQRRLIL